MNLLLEHLKNQYSDKKILILGWGKEGQSTFHLLQAACPDAHVAISDQNVAQASPLPFEAYLENLDEYQVIFKTPGIPIHLHELQEYMSHGGVITSQLNEFLHVYRDQIYGVTGTKGKSTTSSLIAHFLKALNKHTVLAGNIGTPVFDIVEKVHTATSIVIEMSSYQLETITQSPHIAVMLNLFPEHLNYHGDFQHYAAAKANITRFQTEADILVFNQDIAEIDQLTQHSHAQKVPFSYRHQLTYPPAIDLVSSFLPLTQLPETIKKHNVLPALLAVSHHLKTSSNIAQVRQSLLSFSPLPHRLQTVSTTGEMLWIDDTLATIPEATIAALDALPHVDVLMLGGYDRGIDYKKIVDACIKKKVSAILFFKPSGEKMYNLLRQTYPSDLWPVMHVVNDMKHAVDLAYKLAPPQGIVLLSPSSPSFGQFKDYEDKSNQFVHWIGALAPKKKQTH